MQVYIMCHMHCCVTKANFVRYLYTVRITKANLVISGGLRRYRGPKKQCSKFSRLGGGFFK